MSVKIHKNCDYTGKILKISRVRCNLVKFDILSGSHKKFLFVLLQIIYYIFSP